MGLNSGHVKGDYQRFYAVPETTAGTYVRAVAGPATNTVGGGMKVLSSEIGLTKPDEARDDASDSRGEYELFQGKTDIPFSVEMRCIPPSALTARPDWHHLVEGVWGTHTFNSGTSTIYSVLDTLLGGKAYSLTRLVNGLEALSMEALVGAVPDVWTLDVPGTEPPKMTVSGKAQKHIFTGNSTNQGAGTATVLTVTTPQGLGFEVDSTVQLGTDTNTNAGYIVTAFNETTVTVGAGGLTGADQERIRPFAPAATLSSVAIIGHTVGSLTYGGVTFPIQSAKAEVNNNTEFFEDEFGSTGMTDAMYGKRRISGEITMRAREDFLLEISRRKHMSSGVASATELAIVINLGTGAGTTMIFNAPTARPMVDKIELGKGGPGTMTIPWIALDSVEGNLDAATFTVQ